MILVTLCFVAVLGITLASYLAVCSRAMQMSNRNFQSDLSKQLAEAAIEEGLRAFNKNNWDGWTSGSTSVVWDTTTYASDKRAVGTITFPSSKLGQGVTAAVKVRVDNYDAQTVGTSWSNSKSYEIGDVVGYGGNWFTCVTAHSNQAPTATGNLAYWVPAPIPWKWSSDITYSQYDIVNYLGTWYRCAATTLTSTTLPSSDSNWVNIASISLSWNSGVTYSTGAILFNSGAWYTCIQTHTSGATFGGDAAYWDSPNWSNTVTYATGALVYRSGTWYTCRTSHINQAPPNTTYWNSAYYLSTTTYSSGHVVYYSTTGLWYRYKYAFPASGVAPTNSTYWDSIGSSYSAWSSGTSYNVGDRVTNSGVWYTCNTAHSNKAPPNKSYWTATNFPSWQYLFKNYSFNDVVYYSSSGTGTWYRRNVNSPTTVALPTNTSYWENALSDSWDWDSADAYNLGDVVNLSGSFYRCIRAHSNQTPPNTAYWSTEPPYSTYWDENKNYEQYDVVRYRGSWYLSLSASNVNHRPGTDATYWAVAPRSIEPWSATRAYHIDDLVTSSSNWYRCIKDHSNQTVSSGTYWVQVAGSSNVWSASTAYSSGTYRSYGGVWYKSIAATTANAGHTPNNTTYWTAAWSQSSGVTTGAPVIYAEATITLGDSTTSKTQLRVVVDPAPLFPNAAGATTTVTITSGAGTVDSYDSELPDSSDTDGDNYVATNAGYSAVLAAGTGSASGTSTLLSVAGTTTVKGYAAAPSSSSSPYAPRASFGSSVTLKGAASAASPNVDTAQVSRSPYIPQFDIQTPIQQTSIPTTLPNGSTYPLNLGTPGAPTPSVYYFSTNLNIAANEKVNINGPVILRINGYLLSNTGTFSVASTGSAVVYLPYVLRSYASAGGFQNLTKDPKNMLFINTSTTSPTTATYFIVPSGSPKFYGAIYMPNVTATLGLDMRTGMDVYGALSAREVTFSTEANLHYDTSLRYATFSGVDQPYTVTNWTELSTTEAATMP